MVISEGDGIGSGAFTGCTNLTSVTIPEGVTTIDGMTFGNCTI
ncbi:MAG: leucine-rich repeat protein [Blautia marasmi]